MTRVGLYFAAVQFLFVTCWIFTGSSRVSYIGFQMGIGLSLVLIDGPSLPLALSLATRTHSLPST